MIKRMRVRGPAGCGCGGDDDDGDSGGGGGGGHGTGCMVVVDGSDDGDGDDDGGGGVWHCVLPLFCHCVLPLRTATGHFVLPLCTILRTVWALHRIVTVTRAHTYLFSSNRAGFKVRV